MARNLQQLHQINRLKKESKKRRCRLSTVLEDKNQNIREYFAFVEGELEIYDTIGGAVNQVPLTKEEITVVKELDLYGIKALTSEQNNYVFPIPTSNNLAKQTRVRSRTQFASTTN